MGVTWGTWRRGRWTRETQFGRGFWWQRVKLDWLVWWGLGKCDGVEQKGRHRELALWGAHGVGLAAPGLSSMAMRSHRQERWHDHMGMVWSRWTALASRRIMSTWWGTGAAEGVVADFPRSIRDQRWRVWTCCSQGRSLRDREEKSGKDIGWMLEQSIGHRGGDGGTMVAGSRGDWSIGDKYHSSGNWRRGRGLAQ